MDTAALTEHPIRTVWKLAWPAVALNGLQTINALLDSFFVQHLQPAALTAVGASTTAMWLLMSISMAVGVAATAMVSRAFGEGNEDKYRESAQKCLGFAVLVGVVLMFAAFPLAAWISRFMLPPGHTEAAALMVAYLSIAGAMLPAMFVTQTLAGALRGIGDTKSPMVISGIQILLHIALNYVMILPPTQMGRFVLPGFGLGLHGAAWAMVVSANLAAVGYLVWVRRTPLGAGLGLRLPEREWFSRIFRLSARSALMSVVRVTSLIAFMTILSRVPDGDIAIGAIRPGFSLEALAFMPSFGLAVAAAALVGQSLGAGDPARAKRLGWMAAHQAGIVSLVAAIGLYVFAHEAATMVLSDKPEFAATSAQYLRYVCSTEVLFGYGMVLVSAMQGAGDTARPFWLTLVCMWGLRVPLAAYLALPLLIGLPVGLAMGSDGCWLSLAITQAVQGLGAMFLWHKGSWARSEV